jgi:hypothetical protein
MLVEMTFRDMVYSGFSYTVAGRAPLRGIPAGNLKKRRPSAP